MTDFESLPIASATREMSISTNTVWQVLSSLDRLAEWAPGIDGATVTSAQMVGVGTVRRVATAQFGEIEHHVTAWDTDRKFVYETADSGPFSRTLTTYDISGTIGGHATVTVSIAFKIRAGGMTSEQAKGILTKGLEATLHALELQARMISAEV